MRPLKRGMSARTASASRAFRAGLGGAAFGVVGIALLAPPHGETVDLAAVHDERHRLGCFSERDGQQAGCQRVKRAGMAGALGLQQTLNHAHGMGRGHAHRLVEHEPAIHVALLALRLILRFRFFGNDLGQLSSSVLLLRSRWTCGVRNSFSIRSASSNRCVDAEADIRCEFQVDVVRDLATQKALVALERREHRIRVAPTERHQVDRGEPKVGRHLNFRHRDQVLFDDGVMHVPAREHVRERMAHEFADAQLALRAAAARAGVVLMASTGHDRPEFSDARIRPARPSLR